MAPSARDVDRFQRLHPVVGFPLAVVYKLVDDQGTYLAAALTYYAFVAIFPLLLIASSVLGFVLQSDPELERRILDSALSQFPIVGEQLGRPEGLSGSASAIVVGGLAALYGVTGLGQAGQNAMYVVWSVPRDTRPNAVLGRLRSLGLLTVAGLGLLVVTVTTSLAINVRALGADISVVVDWLLRLVSVLLTAAVLAVLFRFATTSGPRLRQVVPGALVVSLLWHALQLVGGVYVAEVVAKASAMNGAFALVLGLMVLLYLVSMSAMVGAEVNAVRTRRLYPRALLSPFSDDADLTAADRRAYTDYARAQRHKRFERVHVTFEPGRSEDEQPPGQQPERAAEQQAERTPEGQPRRVDPGG